MALGAYAQTDACQQKYSDEASCMKDPVCTWCKSAAVPSSCLEKENAKKLPPGVFQCESLVSVTENGPPPYWKKAATARWVVHNTTYGVLSTTSIHLNGTAFGNVQSHVDGYVEESTGTPYFYVSELDASQQDIAQNPKASFTVSEVDIGYCAKKGWDPEDPRCAKVVLSGEIVEVTDPDEQKKFKDALFTRHPPMKSWPVDHNWKVKKMNIEDIWMLDIFGGASIITPADYYNVTL
eukprot:CAMPEP_0167771556 /NCGR_PEP_ID=MMETSP0111_2-20121227/348_1 /TAXON_ID=91324 /ORGANISM="Lotharella globosa, Strain CCCM811" /LENGTH=236 /DNA_ID=CAMNT_0007660931 /DNA_START=41 /DNA_END=751 /DNA_ORIENTATION=-